MEDFKVAAIIPIAGILKMVNIRMIDIVVPYCNVNG